ncbi:MAG: histidine phosphatase family protein [Chloroflexota bacterium]|nr:histidine phosphatase family protein [Chloroflexota bacterium]
MVWHGSIFLSKRWSLHGSRGGSEGRWQGQSDPPLSDLGRSQAREAGAKLAAADLAVTAVVTSDLARARVTGEVLARALGLGLPCEDRDLREYDVGDWEGLTRPEIEVGWPHQLADWKEDRLLATPGGETRSDFIRRIMAPLAGPDGDELGRRPTSSTPTTGRLRPRREAISRATVR